MLTVEQSGQTMAGPRHSHQRQYPCYVWVVKQQRASHRGEVSGMPFIVNVNDSLGEDTNPITSVVVGGTEDHESVVKTVLLL